MQNQQTEWRTVEQLDQIKSSQKGNPKCGVRTNKGWVQCSASLAVLQSLAVGDSIELDGLREWTNPNNGNASWYANIVNAQRQAPENPKPAVQETQASMGHGQAAGNGHGKIAWSDFEAALRAAHKLAAELEPDEQVLFDREGGMHELPSARARARADLVETIMAAFTKGQLELPEQGPPF